MFDSKTQQPCRSRFHFGTETRHVSAIFVSAVLALSAVLASPTMASANSLLAPIAQIDPPGCVPTLTALGPVSLRRGPGVRWPRVATLSANSQAQITGRLRNNTWYQVVFHGQPGWIFSQLVAPTCIGKVPVVPAAPVTDFDTGSFRASPTTVAPGQCSTLSWSVSNVAAVYFTEAGNTAGVAGNATRMVCPQITTQYSLLVKRRDGTSFNSVVVVTVGAPTAIPTSQPSNFRVDNTTINAGQCTTLRWNIDNVAAVFLITGGNTQGVPGNFSQQVCPGNTTSYVLRVQRRDGTTFDTPLTVVVNSATQPNFRADNTTLNLSQCTTLRWDIDNIRGVWLWNPSTRTGVPGHDARPVCPTSTTTYRLEVLRNDGGTSDYFVTVTVNGSAPAPNVTPQP